MIWLHYLYNSWQYFNWHRASCGSLSDSRAPCFDWINKIYYNRPVRSSIRNIKDLLYSLLFRMCCQSDHSPVMYWMHLVLSLQELCCRTIAARTTIYSVNQLPLPTALKAHLKSYLLTASCTRSTSLVRSSFLHRGTSSSFIGSCTGDRVKKHRIIRPSDSPPYNSRSSCVVS